MAERGAVSRRAAHVVGAIAIAVALPAALVARGDASGDDVPTMPDALTETVLIWYDLLDTLGALGYSVVTGSGAVVPCDAEVDNLDGVDPRDEAPARPVYRVTVESRSPSTTDDVEEMAAVLSGPITTVEGPVTGSDDGSGDQTSTLTVTTFGAFAGGATTIVVFTTGSPTVELTTTGPCAELTDSERELFAVISPWTPSRLDRFNPD